MGQHAELSAEIESAGCGSRIGATRRTAEAGFVRIENGSGSAAVQKERSGPIGAVLSGARAERYAAGVGGGRLRDSSQYAGRARGGGGVDREFEGAQAQDSGSGGQGL